MRTIGAIVLCFLGNGFCGHVFAQRSESTTDLASVQDEESATSQALDRVFAQLDSASFHDRHQAFADIHRLATSADLSVGVLQRIADRLSSEDTSADVRWRLRSIWDEHVGSAILSDRPLRERDAAAAIEELRSDKYSVRAAAAFRLKRACESTDEPAPLFLQLKQAALDASDAESRQVLAILNQQLRIRWLNDDAGTWGFPPVELHTIQRHINTLASKSPHVTSLLQQDQAEEELIDLLLQPEATEAVCAEIGNRLAESPLADNARIRLQRILDLTRHVVVIEVWESRESAKEFERVDVTPKSATDFLQSWITPPDAAFGTVVTGVKDGFVRIENCSYLPDGNYPLGQSYFAADCSVPIFEIVELATPKQHLLHRVSRTQLTFAERLRGISERTLDAWLERNQQLDQYERAVLFALHPDVVSVKAPQLLLALDDDRQKMPETLARAAPRASHHQEICFGLALQGRATAAPGIMAAIKAGKILPPVEEDDPFAWPTIALFSIAGRDPWSQSDKWLEAQLASDEKLRLGDEDDRGWNSPQPSARAAAAWLLLKRRGADPKDEQFGLKQLRFSMLDGVACPSCCFQSEEAYHKTREWLKQNQTLPGPAWPYR